jgi:hypothetical protein
MTTLIEDNDGQPRAKLHWGIPEVAALMTVLAALLGGVGVAIRVAVSQEHTTQIAEEAKKIADKATTDVGTLQGDLREVKTDIRWIRQRMEGVR